MEWNNVDRILEEKFRGDDLNEDLFNTYEDEDFDWDLYEYLAGKIND